MPAPPDSTEMPGPCVRVAGYKNIDDSAPPAAMPAKDDPCRKAPCSRMANPPASACAVAITKSPSALPALKKFFQPWSGIFVVPPEDRASPLRLSIVTRGYASHSTRGGKYSLDETSLAKNTLAVASMTQAFCCTAANSESTACQF